MYRIFEYTLTHKSAEPSIRFARQTAAAAVTLGRYCKNDISSKLDSIRYCNIIYHTHIDQSL